MRRLLLAALGLALLPTAAQPQDATRPDPACDTGLRQVNPLFGWQLEWAQALRALEGESPARRAAALAGWRQAGAAVRADVDALRAGLRTGRTAPAAVVDRVLAQTRSLEAQLVASRLADDPRWRELLAQELRPAVSDYARFLAGEYRPQAAPGSSLRRLPGGEACFRQAVAAWTSLDLDPAEIERRGQRLLAETRRELARAAGVPERELPALMRRLREERPATSRAELLRVTEAALARARTAAPRWFAVDDVPPVVVEPQAESLEADAVAGSYRQAAPGAPAAYVVNLSRPAERRLMAEVIAFHETIPGHHLAFAAQRNAGRFDSGFVEGWAIYAEYLADEMGLYGTPRDRLGLHAKHLWAASRLLVEPGLHVRGWTRQQAIDFMAANTLLSRTEIEVEVDRYLAVPGQSLAYMLGADRLRQARARAERALGERFDIRRFHDVVLRPGPRPLAEVDRDVAAWVAAMAAPRA
jgi:uncharacterized protein (DUF885 family)